MNATQLDLFSTMSPARYDLPPGTSNARAGGITSPTSPGHILRTYNPELKSNGTHFFCWGCLSHIENIHQSADERYCTDCFSLLTDEASLLIGTKRKPGWVPKDGFNNEAPPARTATRRTRIKNKAVKTFVPYPNGGAQKKLPKKRIKNMAEKGMPPARKAIFSR